MTIHYCTAAGGTGYAVNIEFPEGIQTRIEAILHNLDSIIPGYYEALSLSNMDIA